MEQFRYYIAHEPDFEGTYWSERYMSGVRREVSKSKGVIVHTDPFDPSDVRELLSSPRPLLILAGSLVDWMTRAVNELSPHSVHCILMTAPIGDIFSSGKVSTVSTDHMKAVASLIEHMRSEGRSRIAFFGINPNSVNDLDKLRVYLKCMGRDDNDREHVFFNQGDSLRACEELLSSSEEYDGVICANDIIAIRLCGYISRECPSLFEKMKIGAIGETRLASLMSPRMITAAPDFFTIGKFSVKLYNMLNKSPELTYMHIKVNAEVPSLAPLSLTYPASSFESDMRMEEKGFYEDEAIMEIFRAERLISQCLPSDIAILRGLSREMPYSEIAAENFMAENTLKYRLKRMLELSGCRDRHELLELISVYLPFGEI